MAVLISFLNATWFVGYCNLQNQDMMIRKPRYFLMILWLLTGCSLFGGKQVLPEPENFSVETIGTDRVLLMWDYPAGEATFFELRVFDSENNLLREKTLPGNARDFVISNLTPGTVYLFQLSACIQGDCSEPAPIQDETTQTLPPSRSFMDRPDEISGPQVHVIYAVPYDGLDRQLDANGTLTASIASFHNWFMQRSGLHIRFDRYNGEVDITFHRFRLTDQELQPWSSRLVLRLQEELKTAGLIREDKIYLIYYDGSSSLACGGASWPPRVPGQSAALYLRGAPSPSSCYSRSFVSSATDFPQYWEFAALHDLLHVLGIVSENAPYHADDYPAHINEPVDLMHSGPQPWILGEMTGIDVLGNNYFGPDVPGDAVHLADSPFVEKIPGHVAVYPFERLSPADAAKLMQAFKDLPMHVPFSEY
ncbi:MAG: fibronectin type III domain-containing protein [Balneolaceae bacterium]|nr:MAG: fibronectin type III domain-containing protein [Balneolaceae bacterium]